MYIQYSIWSPTVRLPMFKKMSIVLVISMLAFCLMAETNEKVICSDRSPPSLALLALNDIMRDQFPDSLKDVTIYVQAMEASKAAEQFDILCGAVDMLNGTRTVRIEQSSRMTEIIRYSKSILNVIIVDGFQSFRYTILIHKLLCNC